MSFDLPAILDLGRLDEELGRLRRRLERAPEQAAPQRQRVAACKRELDRLVEETKRGVLEAKRLEGEAESKKQALGKNEVALNAAKSNDEYQALLKAIERQKDELNDIETAILEAYDEQDRLEAAQKAGAERLAEREKELAAAEERVAALEAELRERIAELEARRAEAAARVDADVLTHYQRVLDKVGDTAIVPIQDETCQGCYYRVRPNQVSLIRGGKEMVVCFHCGRMLYSEQFA
ncbi:MAG: hypothetical protein D6731_08845 [Planctomycetota bacterium]|nr:MAG: hypothetical protein D6731_08845 [Planctomycetota bacterium]